MWCKPHVSSLLKSFMKSLVCNTSDTFKTDTLDAKRGEMMEVQKEWAVHVDRIIQTCYVKASTAKLYFPTFLMQRLTFHTRNILVNTFAHMMPNIFVCVFCSYFVIIGGIKKTLMLFLTFWVFVLFWFWNRVSLYNLGSPRTCFTD